LDRVNHQAKSKLAQFQAEVTTQESTLDLQKRKLERDRQNLENTKITAPADGLAVYAISEGRFSSESMVEEGATVRNRQELIKLPDTSQMKLSIKVHETHVGKIKPGLPAYIVLDPMPDRRFRGYISKVGLLPDAQSRWGNPDLKVYNSEILIRDPLPPEVKPGVSAHAEVIITNLTDVLTVPVQSVTSLQGKPVVYLAGPSPKAVSVEVGMFNTKFIEITSGLKEGDRILLSPPLDADDSNLDESMVGEDEQIPQPAPELPGPIIESSQRRPGGDMEGSPRALGSSPAGADASGAEETRPDGEGRRRGGGGGFNREEMMKQFDTNGDGELDESERDAMRKTFQERFGGGGRPGGRSERPADNP
jgi:hypothetical protein